MATALRANQAIQIQSFWNLIQASDEDVQKELLRLLHAKYALAGDARQHERSRFFSLKGALKSAGNEQTDRRLLDEYLDEKYGV